MKENTPIQQAIQYWTARREEAPTIQMEQAADLFLQYLNASLPAEKEFVGKVWDAAEQFEDDDYMESEHGIKNKTPNKKQFIDKYYSK